MNVRHMALQISMEMSRPAAEKPLQSRGTYPLRRLAHFFIFVGFTAVFYASVLLAIAFESAIIEF